VERKLWKTLYNFWWGTTYTNGAGAPLRPWIDKKEVFTNLRNYRKVVGDVLRDV
jgi:hypothetical protein